MMKTDIEIAQECTMEPITEVAERAGIPEEYLEQYGKYKAKIDYNFLKKSDKKEDVYKRQRVNGLAFMTRTATLRFVADVLSVRV